MKISKSLITILLAISFICLSFTIVKADNTTDGVNTTQDLNDININDDIGSDNSIETNSNSDINNTQITEAPTTSDSNLENNNISILDSNKSIVDIQQIPLENEIKINYEYDSITNIVTAIVTSNIPMKNTKPTWKLSSDKKTYSKSFDINKTYSTPFTLSNGKVINQSINITQIKDMELSTTYKYDSINNIVTAVVTSNFPMRNTKPTWKLSSDKKTYTKCFDSNQTYSTPFTQSNGKVINNPIIINQIKDMELTATYEYDSINNTVTAIVTSNFPMKNTKPTWKLSSDKKTYTKPFAYNQNYSTPFVQSNGKVVNFDINVTDIKPIRVTANYDYNPSKTYVTVTVTSNFPMKNTKPTWKLSSDKMSYTKVFDKNMTYETPFTQTSGANTSLKININQIRDFILTPNYYYSPDRRSVTVTVSSNFKMQNTKPTWQLSADGKTYSKIYTDNMAYSTPFVDEYGRTRDVFININSINKAPELLSNVTLRSPGSGANRNVNLSIASNAINGTILRPGELFIWSNVVGAATPQKGYRSAAVFEGNKVVNGYGGGICQVSSTLYQAIRNIGLNILERHTHSLPVSYTTLGNDATVSHGSLNFIFQNNKFYTIKIEMTSNGGSVNCKIYRI